VYYKTFYLLLAITILCTGCDMNIVGGNAFTATPDFVTATLPSNLVLPTIETSIPNDPTLAASSEPTIIPINGTTTTQVNVRSEPSTVGDSLGIVPAFSEVQVIGKEEYGKWYQIIYSGSFDGKGWVAVAYVQMDAAVEVPVVEIKSVSGHGISGLVIQGINVRSGPGTTYESLGTLIPNDIVTVSGKDPSGAWMEIEFANAPNGKGWAASKFLQVNTPESLPVIGNAAPTETSGTPTGIILPSPSISQLPARQDGDSMSSPFAVTTFSTSGTRTLQANGDVSVPDGDTEDWVQFTSFTAKILVEVKCSNNELRVELWINNQSISDLELACGESHVIKIIPAQPYFLRLQANSSNNFQYIQYSLKVSAVE
jgi:uncharacterized protein YraI